MRLQWMVVATMAGLACGRGTPPAGEVLFGTLTVRQGAISPTRLTDKLSILQPVMEGCYAEALSKTPGLGGTIELRLTGERSGVGAEVTRDAVANASLTQCVRQAVESVKLPDEVGSSPVFVADWSVSFNRSG